MIRQILLFAGLFLSMQMSAQTGIGTITPNSSAKLDVYATNKGFLPPRIALLSNTDIATIVSPANGLIIYNTATAGTTPNNVVPGYYYWDGSKWNGLVDQGALNSFSGYVPNYAQSNASSMSTGTVGAVIVSQSITTSGRPIQIIATGDANPANAAWCQLQLYIDGTAIGKKLQAESSNGNENIPYCLNFIDNPTAGTYTYSVRFVTGSGSFQFGEADGNQITLLELGAWSAGTMPVSKGGTGNSSYTAGSVMFSDGTNIAQNNSKLFWDNSNNRLGIGANAPTTTLDVTGTLGVSSATNLKGSVNVGTGSGSEGGEIDLANAASGTTLTGGTVAIDVYGDKLRFFENGGSNRGVSIDLSKAPNSVGGELMWKASGFVNAGTFLTLDNLKVTCTTGGQRGLSVGAVSTSFNASIAGWFGHTAGGGGASAYNVAYTTTASTSAFGWGFNSAGDTSTYIINDLTNSKVYRIILMIGYGFNNNFITIERLY